MPAIKQVERIIRILQRLALNQQVTVRELYEYFDRGVPKRTLQRDLVELSAADIPLMTRSGRGKELIWYLDRKSLRFIPETIGNRELLASYFMERLATVARGTSLEEDIKSLLQKSRQLVSPTVFRSTDRLDGSENLFGTTFVGYIDYAPHSQTIDRLVAAATERRECHLVYKRATRENATEFDADPYMLLYHKGALYAVVWAPAREKYIFLPIQRIQDISMTGRTFERDPGFSFESLCEGRFGIFGYEGMEPQRVVLRFTADIAGVIAERIWHPTQELRRGRDGSLSLTMEVVISDELIAWIASWLDFVRVESPSSLRDELRARVSGVPDDV